MKHLPTAQAWGEFPSKHARPMGASLELADSSEGSHSFAQAGAGDPLWSVEFWEKTQEAGAHFSSEAFSEPYSSQLALPACPSESC